MKISHLITCSNETDTLNNLLFKICFTILTGDEIIILQDTNSNSITDDILKKYITRFPDFISHFKHDLNNNYGEHKNFGIEKCNGDYVFQLDGDELPSDYLLSENLHSLLKENPTIEAFAVPRVNDFKGVTQEHALKWGWRLTPSTNIIHEKIIDTNSIEYKFLKSGNYILEESIID